MSVCLFVCLFEGPPSIYSWTTGLKKLPEHRTLEEGVPFPPLIATQQLAKLQADLEVRGQGGGAWKAEQHHGFPPIPALLSQVLRPVVRRLWGTLTSEDWVQ